MLLKLYLSVCLNTKNILYGTDVSLIVNVNEGLKLLAHACPGTEADFSYKSTVLHAVNKLKTINEIIGRCNPLFKQNVF